MTKSHEIMKLLKQLNREQNITVVMVTHESDMAAYSDRIIYFVDGRVADVENGHVSASEGGRDR